MEWAAAEWAAADGRWRWVVVAAGIIPAVRRAIRRAQRFRRGCAVCRARGASARSGNPTSSSTSPPTAASYGLSLRQSQQLRCEYGGTVVDLGRAEMVIETHPDAGGSVEEHYAVG